MLSLQGAGLRQQTEDRVTHNEHSQNQRDKTARS